MKSGLNQYGRIRISWCCCQHDHREKGVLSLLGVGKQLIRSAVTHGWRTLCSNHMWFSCWYFALAGGKLGPVHGERQPEEAVRTLSGWSEWHSFFSSFSLSSLARSQKSTHTHTHLHANWSPCREWLTACHQADRGSCSVRVVSGLAVWHTGSHTPGVSNSKQTFWV